MSSIVRAIVVICCTVTVTLLLVDVSTTHAAGRRALFDRMSPSRPPADWKHVKVSSGTAVLSYPNSYAPVKSDPGTVSVAVGTGSPVYHAYLNVTPRQGAEELHGFAHFRLDRLSDEDSHVHEIASAQLVSFTGAIGSCVNDDYRTRVGNNHYEEIACLVSDQHCEYVIVAAALYADWGHFAPSLEKAVEAFDER
jgi:hypothetical protein